MEMNMNKKQSGIKGMQSFQQLRNGIFSFLLLTFFLTGCQSQRALMPTPNLYMGDQSEGAFTQVPEQFQTNYVDLLYVTDRVSSQDRNGIISYTQERSSGAAFGMCRIQFGKDLTWEQLVQDSISLKRKRNPHLTLIDINEMARASNMPVGFIRAGDEVVPNPEDVAELNKQIEIAKSVIRERLAMTSHKDVYLYVHGVANTFESSAFVMAEMWHFMERQGVPIIFSWPAGKGGLRGYFYDRESGEFAVRHLKNTIKVISQIEEVERIHIIAHSRGTDVTLTALREIFLPMKECGQDYSDLKLHNLILAAADLDLQVAQQRVIAEEMFRLPKRFTIYANTKDKAIGVSEWLFSSIERVGQFIGGNLTQKQEQLAKTVTTIQIIRANIDQGFLGHGYFHDNPSVCSDLIAILKNDADPGAENGRPLKKIADGFWELNEGYPLEN
jgi:esterase/lipase superfamily enzyme